MSDPNTPPAQQPGQPQHYDVENIFTYHAPSKLQQAAYEQLRLDAKKLAVQVLSLVPPSRERSLALTKLEETVMWANAGIARKVNRPDHLVQKD